MQLETQPHFELITKIQKIIKTWWRWPLAIYRPN